MRRVTIFGAILLALAAFWPNQATAKSPPGNSGNSGNSGSSGNSGNSGKSGKSGNNWNNNWKWNSWHPYHGDYYHYAQRPIYENPPLSGLPIKIVNPASNSVTLNYTLNGVVYTIPSGYSQKLIEDRTWVVEFSRGADFGLARYGLEPGVYVFGYSDHGWELYRKPVEQTAPVAGPTNPTPPEAAPVNPPPVPPAH
jgi:hypothetical protein